MIILLANNTVIDNYSTIQTNETLEITQNESLQENKTKNSSEVSEEEGDDTTNSKLKQNFDTLSTK